MQKSMRTVICVAAVVVPALAHQGDHVAAAARDTRVTAGELVIENPTLINLGFEWLIQGDDNRNAQVAVSYRKQGDTQWKSALPLLHLQGERIQHEQINGGADPFISVEPTAANPNG